MNFTAKLLLAIPIILFILFWTVIIQKLYTEPVKDQIFMGSIITFIGLYFAVSKNYIGRKVFLKTSLLCEDPYTY